MFQTFLDQGRKTASLTIDMPAQDDWEYEQADSRGPDDLDSDLLDDDTSDVTECPNCGRSIHEDCVQCPHCRQYVTHSDSPQYKPANTLLWLILIVVVLAIVILLSVSL